ncbi:zinc-binding dehydrogenase [Actinomadura nitritigenes]|uniref:zinc-binding dehydrogenase n=1 Tax=Actinomadura nitritigenes TaxID=134602 RepID=UPI003D942547
MRAVQVRAFGAPEVLRVAEVEDPVPEAGEVLVAVEAAGVVFGDTLVRSGAYPRPLPYVPGMEVGGEVVAVGPEVDPALRGRRVVATTPGMSGGYAQLARVAAASAHLLPGGLPLDEAVAVFQAGGLAAGILSALRVGAGDRVLVTAAAGRIGSLLVQLARRAGAGTVIGGVGSAGKLAAVRRAGVDLAVDYSDPGWADAVRERTGGRGVDVVLDAIGGSVRSQAMRNAAARSGRIGVYGFAGGDPAIDTKDIAGKGLTVVGALGVVWAKPEAERRADVEGVLKAANSGELTPRIHRRHPLERAADAHADLEARRNIGAVLLHP